MGEIAEAMLEGLFCGTCGAMLDGDEPGYPRYCSPECEPPGYRDSPVTDAAPRQRTEAQRERRRRKRRRQRARKRALLAQREEPPDGD